MGRLSPTFLRARREVPEVRGGTALTAGGMMAVSGNQCLQPRADDGLERMKRKCGRANAYSTPYIQRDCWRQDEMKTAGSRTIVAGCWLLVGLAWLGEVTGMRLCQRDGCFRWVWRTDEVKGSDMDDEAEDPCNAPCRFDGSRHT